MMGRVKLPARRHLVALGIAVGLLVVLSRAATWQVGALGAGLVVIGTAMLLQNRRARRSS
jgi:hypothetical protein